MSTLPVVERILREVAVPMSVREIVERAGETLPTKSKTPDTVVARDLSMDIKKKGEKSLFIRTSPGRYAMREHYGTGMTPPARVQGNGAPSNGASEQPTRMTDVVGERQAAKPKTERPGTESPETQTDSASV